MTFRCHRAAGWVGLLGAAILGSGSAQSQGNPGDIDRVVAHLQRQQDQTKVVRIRAAGDRLIIKGSYTDGSVGLPEPGAPPLPPEDERAGLKQDFLLDFQDRRYRRAYQEVLGGKLASWVQVFDGKKSYGSKIDVPIEQADNIHPTRMSIISGGDHVNWFNSEWWPYFMSQGFILTSVDHHYYSTNIRPPFDRENLFIRGSESIGGQTCDVVRTFPVGSKQNAEYFEYAIDRKDGSVRRMTLRVGERKSAEIRVSYRKAGDRVIPERWTNEWYSNNSPKMWRTETMTVTAVDYATAVDPEKLTLTAAPGTIVKEQRYPSGRINLLDNKVEQTTIYQADESGRLIEGELVNGEFRPHRPYLWWIVGVVGAVAVLVGWVLYRRARSRASRGAEAGSPAEGRPT